MHTRSTLRASLARIVADLLGGSAGVDDSVAATDVRSRVLKLDPPLRGALELGGGLPPVPWIALGWHTGALRRVVLDAKFEGKLDALRGLALPLANAIKQGWALDGGGELDGKAVVVPVPAAWSRRFTRGRDQVQVLASALAGQLGLSLLHCLRRAGTGHSIGLSGADRRRRASQFVSRRASVEPLEARSVILVDDVHTTGTTIRACATELLRMGATGVLAVTASITPCPGLDLRPSNEW